MTLTVEQLPDADIIELAYKWKRQERTSGIQVMPDEYYADLSRICTRLLTKPVDESTAWITLLVRHHHFYLDKDTDDRVEAVGDTLMRIRGDAHLFWTEQDCLERMPTMRVYHIAMESGMEAAMMYKLANG